MSATRIFQRRLWRSDCPAVFNRSAATRRAEKLGLKVEELANGRRMSFLAWRRKHIPTQRPHDALREWLRAIQHRELMSKNFGTPS